MRQRMLARILLFAPLLCTGVIAQEGRATEMVGSWRGKSTCTVRPSACHDEDVIYEITASTQGKLSWKADKVVEGRRETMGVLDCMYEHNTLSCPFAKGIWSFQISGAKMTGTLRLTDGVLFRTVDVSRESPVDQPSVH